MKVRAKLGLRVMSQEWKALKCNVLKRETVYRGRRVYRDRRV